MTKLSNRNDPADVVLRVRVQIDLSSCLRSVSADFGHVCLLAFAPLIALRAVALVNQPSPHYDEEDREESEGEGWAAP